MASRSTTERLDGWEAISEYLGWHQRTVIRWEKQKGLPVHRVAGGKRQPVYAYRHELDAWYQSSGNLTASPSNAVAPESPAAASSPPGTVQTWLAARFITVMALGLGVVLIAALAAAWRLFHQSTLQIASIEQLTSDDTAKWNLLTDGKRLYFTEETGDHRDLAAIPIGGGQIQPLDVRLPSPAPIDLTPDGRWMLVTSRDGPQEEGSLWVLDLTGGQPSRVAGVTCGTAAWTPKGDQIVFAHGRAIFQTTRDGSDTRLLTQVSGVPLKLLWSADGKILLTSLWNQPGETISVLQVSVDNNLNATNVRSLELGDEGASSAAFVARARGEYFAVSHQPTVDRILRLTIRHGGVAEVSSLATRFKALVGLAVDPRTKKIFVLNGGRSRGELVEYDPPTRRFSTYLPGASAMYVDVSKSNGRIVYVQTRDRTLWASNPDGSEPIQLSPSGIEVQLPRWSPDGKEVAFMGKISGRPFRIFVTPANRSEPKEASKSTDSQGAPTWSPDGRFLVYGNVLCQEERTCAIRMIDVANGKVTVLPASQGLGTARWSPDGRHIAALNPIEHQLWVFDLMTRRWRRLLEGINGNDISWSSDSSFVYTKSSMSGKTEILRVAVGGGHAQSVLSLDAFSRSAGQLDTWFSLTPDDHIILNRWLDSTEIYALRYNEN